MSQVYISALREAEGEVRQIKEALERLRPGRVRVVQPSAVPLTRDYLQSLQVEIDTARVMVVFVGPKWVEAVTDVKSHPVGRLLLWEIEQVRRSDKTILSVTLCDQLGSSEPNLALDIASLPLCTFEWRSGTSAAERFSEQVLGWLDFDAASMAQAEEAFALAAAPEERVIDEFPSYAFQVPVPVLAALLTALPDDVEVAKWIDRSVPPRGITAEALRWMVGQWGQTLECSQWRGIVYLVHVADATESTPPLSLPPLFVFEYSPLFALFREHHDQSRRQRDP